jgi:hypothetical protein
MAFPGIAMSIDFHPGASWNTPAVKLVVIDEDCARRVSRSAPAHN